MYLIQAVKYECDEEGELNEPRVVEQEVVVLCDDKSDIEKAKNAADAEIKGAEADEINVYNLEEEADREAMIGVVSADKAFIAEMDSVAAGADEQE